MKRLYIEFENVHERVQPIEVRFLKTQINFSGNIILDSMRLMVSHFHDSYHSTLLENQK